MSTDNKTSSHPWRWIPSLYFAEGIPYVVVMMVAVVLYKRMGISNTDIALYTSWLYLPWVIKPLWSPFVDLLQTKRIWILTTQLLIGAGLAGVAFTIPLPGFFQWTLAAFWLLAFSSATHDIAADGFYMIGISEQQQAFFVGIRSTFYRFAMIAGQGFLIMLAGALERSSGLEPASFTVEVRTDVSQPVVGEPTFWNPAAEGERVLVSQAKLTVPLGLVEATDVAAIRKRVTEWNEKHGFVTKKVAADAKQDESGFWQENISGPLGNWIRNTFGEERKEAADTGGGAIAVVALRISKPPAEGDATVVAIERKTGDRSFALIAGEALRFTSANAHTAAMVAVQIDPRMPKTAEARFEARAGNVPFAWSITFFILSGLFIGLFVWHRFAIPKVAEDRPTQREDGKGLLADFIHTFASFFKRPGILMILAFLLLYRFGEAQLVKLAAPFLLDGRDAGGLSLSTGQVGFAYGTVGVLALTIGGILGGLAVSRHGLKRWLMVMVVAINLPNAVYIFLAATQPESFAVVNGCIAIEQFGYGFGFTAYMMYMIMVAQGPQKTAHFAITTGFMALGMMIPGMFSGWLQEALGYQNFFTWVLIATIPGFLVAAMIKIDPEFGRKRDAS